MEGYKIEMQSDKAFKIIAKLINSGKEDIAFDMYKDILEQVHGQGFDKGMSRDVMRDRTQSDYESRS